MARGGNLGALDVPVDYTRFGLRYRYSGDLLDCRSYEGFSGSPCVATLSYAVLDSIPSDLPPNTVPANPDGESPQLRNLATLASFCGILTRHYSDENVSDAHGAVSRYSVCDAALRLCARRADDRASSLRAARLGGAVDRLRQHSSPPRRLSGNRLLARGADSGKQRPCGTRIRRLLNALGSSTLVQSAWPLTATRPVSTISGIHPLSRRSGRVAPVRHRRAAAQSRVWCSTRPSDRRGARLGLHRRDRTWPASSSVTSSPLLLSRRPAGANEGVPRYVPNSVILTCAN
jgi:hypothetical protein